MSFEVEALKKNSRLNLVIKIENEYFSQRQVDSGLIVDSEKIGRIKNAKISGNSVDIRKVKTSIANLTFQLLDKDGYISTFLMLKNGNYLESNVELYAGFTTGSFDFANYKKFTTTKLVSIERMNNGYNFKCSEIASKIKQESYFNYSQLDGDVTDVATSLNVVNAENFPSSGRIKINDEYITYTTKTLNALSGLGRGDLASTASEHKSGSEISIVTTLLDQPQDMMLDIMQNQLNIPTSEIDFSSFTNIRDDFFSANQLRFYTTGFEDTLSFFEDEILQLTNCRITTIDGKIGLAILDQTDFTSSPSDLDESKVVGTPSWSIGSNKIGNEVVVHWAYDEGTNRYTKTSTFKDSDSIALYGKKKSLVYNFKGARTDLDGNALVTNMGARLLARTKNVQSDIKVNSFFSNASLKIGDDVSVTHRFLPQQGGSLGMADQRLEIMSKAFDFDSKRVSFKLQFTSFSNLRVGLISPSPYISSVTDQRTFDVPDGSQYKAGYFLRLWDVVNNQYYPDSAIEIASVVGNTITMKSNFSTTLTTSIKIYFPSYSQSSDLQKGKYIYAVDNTNFFGDGTKGYEIIF